MSELQQKFLFVATVSNAPDTTRYVMPSRSCLTPPSHCQSGKIQLKKHIALILAPKIGLQVVF
jgi:hypothetical protein